MKRALIWSIIDHINARFISAVQFFGCTILQAWAGVDRLQTNSHSRQAVDLARQQHDAHMATVFLRL